MVIWVVQWGLTYLSNVRANTTLKKWNLSFPSQYFLCHLLALAPKWPLTYYMLFLILEFHIHEIVSTLFYLDHRPSLSHCREIQSHFFPWEAGHIHKPTFHSWTLQHPHEFPCFNWPCGKQVSRGEFLLGCIKGTGIQGAHWCSQHPGDVYADLCSL